MDGGDSNGSEDREYKPDRLAVGNLEWIKKRKYVLGVISHVMQLNVWNINTIYHCIMTKIFSQFHTLSCKIEYIFTTEEDEEWDEWAMPLANDADKFDILIKL